jgi:hypothetical protein
MENKNTDLIIALLVQIISMLFLNMVTPAATGVDMLYLLLGCSYAASAVFLFFTCGK